ncbi:ROK family transcriptional regulator [Alicyclobacillus fastidiosus]|uniref:ROK family transcriptional regulator n=1 Tax=Alicyclobacillus fastidiosus TaxID=392011 RepID=A0ABV5AE49_9BACL|nr:ROK family transcriptional regulator [Alicyclobacillus fastidiosus]WEH09867.1 ROK family transcriptional regulator [Alicyclobacillus fastidiosus]
MAKTVDAATMRQINKKYVTEMIYNQGPLSRIDISQATGLNKATVSSLVDELIEQQFVQEIGFGTSSGGRKPVMLKINSSAGYCIGVDVQITHMKTVLTDLTGGIVYKRIRPMDAAHGRLSQSELEEMLIEEIDCATHQAPPSCHGILGAGIALPGIVNYRTGSAFYLPNIEIENWDVIGALSQSFAFPIFIDNDGNCGAWSLYRERQEQNLVFVNVGIGIGTGIVVNGQLYRGSNGIAGEFGHTSIAAMGVVCACGSYGCWEQYASEQALLRYLRESEDVPEALELSPNLVSLAVEQAATQTGYQQAFRTLGQYLGVGIANIVNAINPGLVVIGGPIAQAAALFLPEVERVVHHRAMATNKHVALSVAHEDAIVVGAAQLPIANTLLQSPLAEV